MTRASHGLLVGDEVILFNVNLNKTTTFTITAVTTNTFDVTVVDSGATSGDGSYFVCFSTAVTQTAGDVTAVVASINASTLLAGSQLNVLTVFCGNQESICVVTVPAGLNQGAGGYTNKNSINPVTLAALNANGTGNLPSIVPTATYNGGSNFNQIKVSSIDAFASVIFSVRF